MRLPPRRLGWLLVALTLLSPRSALHAVRIGAYSGQIGGLQLVTADFGWVYGQGKLLRTADGGRTWIDITPPAPAQEYIGNIFFLDSQHGWAISSQEKPDSSGESVFRTLATDDGGASWHSYPMSLECRFCIENSFISDLVFLDPQRGWVLFDVGGSFRSGVLFGTTDGGRTWTKLSTPDSGTLRFITPSDGWQISTQMTGSPLQLYGTRDGGRSWQEQILPRPPGLEEHASANFGLPTFRDANRGTLAASFIGGHGPFHYRSMIVLYETGDGGLHWKIQRVFPPVDGWSDSPIISDRQVIWAYVKDGRVIIAHDGSPGPPSAQSYPLALVVRQRFADAHHGWLMVQRGGCNGFKCGCLQDTRLLITADGGSSFMQPKIPGMGPPKLIAPCGADRPKSR